MLVVLLQLIEKNHPAKAPSPKTIPRMRAVETSPPSIPVSVSSLPAGPLPPRRPPGSTRRLSFLSSLPFVLHGSLWIWGREPEAVCLEHPQSRGPKSRELCGAGRRAGWGKGRRRMLLPQEGAGRAQRIEPETRRRPSPKLPRPRTDRLWAVLRKQAAQRSLLCG